jgi:ABC-2 type transport system ATP-binding protein
MISVHDFHKIYGDTVAVSGLSFSIPPRTILGLVGPNGAGKTTTLRTLAGIIPPTLGTLSVDGSCIVNQPIDAKGKLAFIPDDPKLFEALTVWEHLLFVASAYRVSNFEPAAEKLLDDFELREKRDVVAQELSRGMRQKTAICCGYLHNPQAILFDEPLTGLDPRAIRTLKDSIAERARSGAAIVISSHLLSLVEDLCDQLLILHKGRSLFFGALSEARARSSDSNMDASLEEIFFQATEE